MLQQQQNLGRRFGQEMHILLTPPLSFLSPCCPVCVDNSVVVSSLFAFASLCGVVYSLVVTFCEKADLLALSCVMFSCVFATFPYCVTGWVWCLIVLISDL